MIFLKLNNHNYLVIALLTFFLNNIIIEPATILAQEVEDNQYGIYSQIQDAMDWNNSRLRNHVLNILKNPKINWNNSDNKVNQLCTIFSKIHDNWTYVNDPFSREYFSKASETMETYSGDCDDYAIFMASCLYVMGLRTRVVVTDGHAYPEVYAGESYEELLNMQKQFLKSYFLMSSKIKALYYHEEENGYWINLDWTSDYPGGDYANDGEYLFVVYPLE